MSVTEGDIKAALRSLGVRQGDGLIVHSSLSNMGWVEGGADIVVGALVAVIGDNGTVLMPTFTDTGPEHPFSLRNTPSETGAVSEALRLQEYAVRSRHPTHSVAAIGSNAEQLVADHDPLESLGLGSPMQRLIEGGGDILLIGVDHTSNSAIHIAEKLAGVPYRDQMKETAIVDESGGREVVKVNQVHCSLGFGKIESIAKRVSDVITYGTLGDAESQLIDGSEFLSLCTELLEEQPGLLLCDSPACKRCQYARRAIIG